MTPIHHFYFVVIMDWQSNPLNYIFPTLILGMCFLPAWITGKSQNNTVRTFQQVIPE